MKKILFALFTLSLLGINGPVSAEEEPKTSIESFSSKTGFAYLMSYKKIGSLKGVYGHNLELQARIIVDTSSNKEVKGVKIELYDKITHNSFVDYEEIGALFKAIDYLIKVKKSPTNLDYWEARYKTKSGLEITTYNNSKGEVKAVIQSGSGQVFFATPDSLFEFKKLLYQAKEALDKK